MSIELLPDVAVGFATEPLPTRDGYRFSLTTLLGTMLSDAEQMFGPRDMAYTPLGIEFSGDRPLIWYPGDRQHVSIILTDSARTDFRQAIFQLAHEVVHLLAPSGSARAPVIEEGLAALNQQRATEKYALGYVLASEPYVEATKLANQLLEIDPGIIRELREKEPAFHNWTPGFLTIEAGIAAGLAERLTMPFADFETGE